MEGIDQLAKALVAFQAEVVTVKKDAANPFFKSKYAPLDSIMLAAMPVLTRHGLAITQLVDNMDGQTALTTVLMHVSGQSIRSTMPLVLAKNDPQGQGSAITYARRYSYAATLGIVIDEDDDGNRGSTPAPVRKQQVAPRPVYQPPTPAADPNVQTRAQQAKMMAMFNARGITDREERLAYCAMTIGKDITSSAEMTRDEAALVINALELDGKEAA